MVRGAPTLCFAFIAVATGGCNAILGIEDHGLASDGGVRESAAEATTEDVSSDSLRDAQEESMPDHAMLDVSSDFELDTTRPEDASTDPPGDIEDAGDGTDSATLDVAAESTDRRDGDANDGATDAHDAGPTCPLCPVPTNGHATCEAGVCGISCDTNWTACGTECVSVLNDAKNCGRCSHDCGNGACSQGICQPTTILSNIDAPRGLAVDTTGVYFTLADRILSCPLDGCVQAPRQLGSNLSLPGLIAVANGTVAFASALDVAACPIAGCGATPTILWTGSGVNRPQYLVASGTDIYTGISGQGGSISHHRCVAPAAGCGTEITIITGILRLPVAVGEGMIFMNDVRNHGDAGASLVACPVTQPCENATTVASNWEPARILMAAAGGNLYFPLLDNRITIAVCPQSGCDSVSTFAPILGDILELIADAAGVHWIQGTPGAASIATCPLSGCVGGPQIVAHDQPLASYLQSDGQFLYWVNRGTPIDGGTDPEPGTAAIVRVAH